MKEGQRIMRGLLTTTVLVAGLQFSKPSEAQNPPPLGQQNNMLFIPYIAPFEKSGTGIIFPPSTPTPENKYKSPKMTPIPESCDDEAPGRKVQDVLAELSDAADSVFPGPGLRYIGVALKKEDLSENPDGKKYARLDLNGYRRMVIKADLSNASENPLGTLQAGQEYVAAMDHVSPTTGFPSFAGAEVTIFKAIACLPKN